MIILQWFVNRCSFDIGWPVQAGSIQRLGDESESFYRKMKPGHIFHYHNAFEQFVRCEAVKENGKMVLRPTALVGKWSPTDLPHRRMDGSVSVGYHAKRIADGETFSPSACNITEFNLRLAQEYGDPSKMDAIDLSVPEATPEQETQAKLHAIRMRAIDALAQPEPMAAIRDALSILAAAVVE